MSRDPKRLRYLSMVTFCIIWGFFELHVVSPRWDSEIGGEAGIVTEETTGPGSGGGPSEIGDVTSFKNSACLFFLKAPFIFWCEDIPSAWADASRLLPMSEISATIPGIFLCAQSFQSLREEWGLGVVEAGHV